jgi:fumarate hydratase class I
VLDVKVLDYPTHAASLPVAVIPNCAATRHIHFTLDGSGPALLEPPDLDLWPKVQWAADASARRVSLDGLTRAEIASWKPGERLLLSGKLLTGRDAAHKRICALLDAGQPLPEGLDFHGRVIYYVGPVDPVGTKSWVPRVRPPRIAWIASPTPCSANRAAGDGRQGRARPGNRRVHRASTAPPT